jgi:hypothetical protein
MTFQERQLELIAKSLGSIDESLKQLLDISRAGKSAPAAGDDCSRCWCATCENRESCQLAGVGGSPCNSCRPGQRFVTIGRSKCENYKERQERRF